MIITTISPTLLTVDIQSNEGEWPISVDIQSNEGEWPISEVVGWELEISEEPWAGPGPQLRVRARWTSDQPAQAGLVIRRQTRAPGAMRVLVPAVFYGDNGPGSP